MEGSFGGRTRTGVAGLDPLLQGGFPANRAVVLCGGVGTGKTTVALQFVAEGVHAGEPGVLVSVDQSPRHLLDDAAHLGLDLKAAATTDRLVVLDASPYFTAARSRPWRRGAIGGLDARQVASDLVQQVRRVGARRLVIDGINALVPPDMGHGHAYDYLRSLMHSFEDNLECTVLLTCRASAADPQGSCEAVRGLATGVVELRIVRRRRELVRTLLIRKMRGTALDLVEYRVAIERGSALSVEGPVAPPSFGRGITPHRRTIGASIPRPLDHPEAV